MAASPFITLNQPQDAPQWDELPRAVITVQDALPIVLLDDENAQYYAYPARLVPEGTAIPGGSVIVSYRTPVGRWNSQSGQSYEVYPLPAEYGRKPPGTTIVFLGGPQERITFFGRYQQYLETRQQISHPQNPSSRASGHRSCTRSSQQQPQRSSSSAHPLHAGPPVTNGRDDPSPSSAEENGFPPTTAFNPQMRSNIMDLQREISRCLRLTRGPHPLRSGEAGDIGSADITFRDNELCPICLEEMSRGTAIKRCPSCCSPFHPHCIGQARDISINNDADAGARGFPCPCCRLLLSSESVV